MEENLTKQIKKEARPMRGQGSLVVILLALLALGTGVFFITSMKSSEERKESVTNPVDYAEKNALTTPAQTAQDTLKNILEVAGIPPANSGSITSGTGYNISYVGPVKGKSWGDFWVEITANTADGVVAAKAAAEQWFLDQGYQPEDFCAGTPVIFYLSPESSKVMQDAGQTFSRIPSSCQ